MFEYRLPVPAEAAAKKKAKKKQGGGKKKPGDGPVRRVMAADGFGPDRWRLRPIGGPAHPDQAWGRALPSTSRSSWWSA